MGLNPPTRRAMPSRPSDHRVSKPSLNQPVHGSEQSARVEWIDDVCAPSKKLNGMSASFATSAEKQTSVVCNRSHLSAIATSLPKPIVGPQHPGSPECVRF
jgi:hypothetical protein